MSDWTAIWLTLKLASITVLVLLAIGLPALGHEVHFHCVQSMEPIQPGRPPCALRATMFVNSSSVWGHR